MLEDKLTNIAYRSPRLFDYALGIFFGISTLFGCAKEEKKIIVEAPQATAQANNPPLINSIPKTSAVEGDNFFDKVIATDLDNDILTYLFRQSPSGVIINANSGDISWSNVPIGNFPITIEVNDGKNGSAFQNYNLNIIPKTVTPTPQNNPPIITSIPKTSALEGDNFFDKVNANDPDNDVLTYLFRQSPSGVTINANDGSINWIDAQEGTFPIEVEVNDGKGGKAIQNYSLDIINALDNISGKITDISNGSPVNDIEVILGHRINHSSSFFGNGDFVSDFLVRTDANGNYLFTRIPTNLERIIKIANHQFYRNHLAGSIKTTKDETGVNFEIIPVTFDLSFYDHITRWDGSDANGMTVTGRTKRWLRIPQIYIDLRDDLDQPTNQYDMDLVESILRNDIPIFTNGFIPNNIQVTRGINPPLGIPGYINFKFRDSTSSRRDTPTLYIVDNEIISATVTPSEDPTPQGAQTWAYTQLISKAFGATDVYDASTQPTIFRGLLNPFNGITTFQPADLILGKILYTRSHGHRVTIDAPDSNPDEFRIR